MVFWPFLWFWPKHENGQKSIFSFEKWKFFFWHTLVIWGDLHFSVFTFLIWSKKVGKNGKNTLLWKGHFFSFFPFLNTLFDWIKCVLHKKCWSSQWIKMCPKKFPLFKIKNGFLAIFVILAKTQKWPFFWESGIFFCAP